MSISFPSADFAPTLSGYTGQGAFRFWCQKVLPIVYDDSLSYYELLNKVVIYLNNIIKDVAACEENVDSLATAYKLLEEFVNNFIEYVTPEVVESVLEEHPEWVTTVQDGSITARKLEPNFRAEVINAYITPEMYGAVGDGTADDTIAFQAAIDASLEQHKPFIATKSYLVSETVNIWGFKDPDTREIIRGRNVNIDMTTATITYTGNNYAFDIHMIECGIIFLGKIVCPDGGGIIMECKSSFSAVSFLWLNGGKFECNPEKDCIYVETTNTGWWNQNKLTDIYFRAGNSPVHLVSNGLNKINENIIENCDLEGVMDGIYLEAKTDVSADSYIRDIKMIYNRGIEHINSGKVFLRTYGRVMNCYIKAGYGDFHRERAYSFTPDNSGSSNYLHVAHNIRIESPSGYITVLHGKICANPVLLASACNGLNISTITDETESLYKNYFGTIESYIDKVNFTHENEMASEQFGNLNNYWLAGVPTDVYANRIMVQEMLFADGRKFNRPYNPTGGFGAWSQFIMGRGFRRKPAHGTDFTYRRDCVGLFVISSTAGTLVGLYFVRFGGGQPPTLIFNNWGPGGDGTAPWTVTKTGTYSLHLENSSYTAQECYVGFVSFC